MGVSPWVKQSGGSLTQGNATAAVGRGWLTRSTVPRPAAQGSEAYETAAEQQERSWLWHKKVNDCAVGLAVQHTERKGGVARVRSDCDVVWKRCVDQLDGSVTSRAGGGAACRFDEVIMRTA